MESPNVLAYVDVQGIRYAVAARRGEHSFDDGTSVWLHAVQHEGQDRPFLRALHSHGAWVVFDLRHLAVCVSDVDACDATDTMSEALSLRFASAAVLVAQAGDCALGWGPTVLRRPQAIDIDLRKMEEWVALERRLSASRSLT